MERYLYLYCSSDSDDPSSEEDEDDDEGHHEDLVESDFRKLEMERGEQKRFLFNSLYTTCRHQEHESGFSTCDAQ